MKQDRTIIERLEKWLGHRVLLKHWQLAIFLLYFTMSATCYNHTCTIHMVRGDHSRNFLSGHASY